MTSKSSFDICLDHFFEQLVVVVSVVVVPVSAAAVVAWPALRMLNTSLSSLVFVMWRQEVEVL